MRIHRAGYRVIPIAAILLGCLYFVLYVVLPYSILRVILAMAGLIFFVFIVRFFRDPLVDCPQLEGGVYAPADGKVVVIEKTTEEEFLRKEAIQVSIFMSPLNVHVNRSPVAGRVRYFKHHPGKYLVAWHPKSSTLNERTTIGLEMDSGTRITTRQIAGAVARRIFFYPKEGDQLKQGQEMGFIRFGSRLDVFLPLDAEIKVKLGDNTRAGLTELARLV
jgi:phosphatidylserine decarboxylase